VNIQLFFISFLLIPFGIKAQKLRFLDEYILDEKTFLNERQVGGLSGIDYKNGKWIAICDDSEFPRYYELDIQLNDSVFTKVAVLKEYLFKDHRGNLLPKRSYDPESLRFIKEDRFIWSSEGNIKNGVNSEIIALSPEHSNNIEFYDFPFLKIKKKKFGPRHNGAIEALSLLNNKLWFTTELPLLQDGKKATYKDNGTPLRLTQFNIETKTFNQYTYSLEKVTLKPKRKKDIALNGVVEILNINETELFVLERSYTSGYGEAGTHIKLFKVSTQNATDVSKFKSLKKKKFKTVTKELVLDFNAIKSQFPSKHVDNIEGMCWGPKLKNGNQTLVFVADNNFNLYGKQLNQFLFFEVVISEK